jgi:hypothetical protein
MEVIIKKYNDEMKDTPGFMKVKLAHHEGGYGDYMRSISGTQILNHSSDIANAFIDYPTSVGILASDFQELDLKEVDKDIAKNIDPEVMKINNRIGGLKQGGVYSVPFALSSEMLSVNGPLFKKVVDDFVLKGAINNIKKNHELTDLLSKTYPGEKLEKLPPIKSNATLKGFTIDDETFTNYEKLLEFSTKIAQNYDLKASGKMRVLGHDAPTNLLYEMVYSLGGNDFKNFLFNNDKDDSNYIKYDTAMEKPAVKEAVTAIINAVDNGALSIFGGGAYGSADFVHHRMLFEIGSSAGFSHTFIKKGGIEYTAKLDISREGEKHK